VLAELCYGSDGGPADGLTEVNDLTGQIVSSALRTPARKSRKGASAGLTGSEKLLSLIKSSLDQDGAEDILAIALAGKSPMADFLVIATGRSTRHVSALCDNLVEKLKHEMDVTSRIEGKDAADWVLVDTGDVIVHIFRPEVREFYQLEKMWQTAPDMTARPA
jgi:ribosome-associated protein